MPRLRRAKARPRGRRSLTQATGLCLALWGAAWLGGTPAPLPDGAPCAPWHKGFRMTPASRAAQSKGARGKMRRRAARGAPACATESGLDPEISVIVPVKNEAENIRPLIDEIVRALGAGERYEIVYVDDGSTDATPEVLRELRAELPALRALRHERSSGQSAAIRTGVAAARGALIITLDGDGQNDPADIPALVARFRMEAARDPGLGMVAGQRRKRHDSLSRRLQSRIANRVRQALLKDGTQDTGCSLKAFPRALFLELPYFDHMHRFLPALVKREGRRIAFLTVNHRPRRAGRSHYGLWGRLGNAITDLLGVVWLMRRRRLPGEIRELS